MLQHNSVKACAQVERPHPLLAAYSCSTLSLAVSAASGLQAEVSNKVAKLPPLLLHEEVGTARLALIGITDLHRQLSRLRTRESPGRRKPGPGGSAWQGSRQQRPRMGKETPGSRGPCEQQRVLEVACSAAVAVADRLALHGQYTEGCGLYLHRRSAAVVRPYGPLSKEEGTALEKLLLIFESYPELMCADVCDLYGGGGGGTSKQARAASHVRALLLCCVLCCVL